MQHAPTRVLIVDDTFAVRTLLTAAIEAADDMELVGQAHNGLVATMIAEGLQPDVIVLDLQMPVMDGFEAMPLLREIVPDARIVVWTGLDDRDTRARSLERGASAFLLKSSDSAKVLEAIRYLSSAQSFAPPQRRA